MANAATRVFTPFHLTQILVAIGFGTGAALGYAGHLAGFGGLDLVPIGAGFVGGVVSAVACAWNSVRGRS